MQDNTNILKDEDIAISAQNIKKMYKLYDKPMDRLKESLGLSRKKRYKEHYALNDVSMTIKKGETVGIIGTNGSGKSTMLKIITGVLNPTEGDVKVKGRISALLELGAGFNMEYNGIENIYLNGTMIGFSEKEIDERLDSILEFADIGDYVYQPVKTYSSGMFVRLAFAVAISIDPEILIVDEALSVGDVFFQAKCYHKFEEFKKAGKTILFVSHDLSSISKYCDRVILINKGIKLKEGSPKEIIDIYKRLLVGQYNPDDEVKKESDNISDGKKNAPEEEKNPEAKSQNQTDIKPDKSGNNADTLEYGSLQAEIIENYVTDDAGNVTTAIEKGKEYTVHMVVRFNEDLPAPIFACSIKNALGIEITGTNTMVEKAFLDSVKAGSVMECTFRQKMQLQGGEYLISLGLTGFEGDEFKVYHRLYDVSNLTVISSKNTVGYFDTESVVTVKPADN